LFYLAQNEKYGNFTDDMLKYQVVVSLFSALVEVGESAERFYIIECSDVKAYCIDVSYFYVDVKGF